MAKSTKPKSRAAKSKTSKSMDATVESKETDVVEATDAVVDATPDTSDIVPDNVEKPEPDTSVDTPPVADTDSIEPVKGEDIVEEIKRPEEPAPVAVPVPEEKQSIFLPLVLGGIIAAGLGWGISEFNRPAQLPTDSGLKNRVAAVEESSAETAISLASRITALESAPEVAGFDAAVLDPVLTEVSSLSDTITDLDARLTALEKSPIAVGASDIAVKAYERELAALQSSVQDQRAEIEALLSDALQTEQSTAEQATKTAAEASLIKVLSALDSGAAFAEPLAAMAQTGAIEIPAALTDVADSGVATLSALQEGFPDVARAALSTARAAAPDSEGGFGSFLKRQLGARSVVPREGDDPDAVLSRAEAAIRAGQTDAALKEIDALPEVAQEQMQDWLSNARARAAAQAAAQELAQQLSAQ